MESTHSLRTQQWRIGRAGPAVAALVYPAILLGLFNSARMGFTHGQGVGIVRVILTLLALMCVFAVPLFAMVQCIRLGTQHDEALGMQQTRLVAHLAFASPALFTFLGVLTYMASISFAENVIWGTLWLVAIVFSVRAARRTPRVDRRVGHWLPVAHGATAAILVFGFIALHLANHLVAVAGPEAHIAVMKVLRNWYRSPVVEPLLVILMLFMVGSGLVLVRSKLSAQTDVFGTLQTLTGFYLLIFITGHMNSVFVFQRSFVGKDTDFWFAAGGPDGLLADAWSVRLIPHYVLGVWSVVTHAACGLRGILTAHGIQTRVANGMTIALSASAAIAASLMGLALCRFQLF